MEPEKSRNIRSIEDIQQLFDELKAQRKVITWQEFAEKLDYGRPYVSRVMNEKEPLTAEFIDRVKRVFGRSTKDVPHGTQDVAKVDYREKYIELLEKQCKDADTIKEVLINLDELQKMVVATAMNVKVNQRLIEVVSAQAGKKLNFGQEVSRIASDVSREFSEQGIGSLKSR